MKYLLICLLFITSFASAQYSPTGAKTRFVNGIGFGTKDTTGWSAADTVVMIMGRDSTPYIRYKGYWKALAYSGAGSVTSVATNDATGIKGGTITSSGTLRIDTSIIATRLRVQKAIDSVNANIALRVKYSDTATMLTPYLRTVGLTMPVAFNVAGSPITGHGNTIAVTGAGLANQYIRGDGQLATFPSSGAGGSSINYYLNGGTAASVSTYYQMSNIPVIGTGVDFTIATNGVIAQFLTDAGNPNRLSIPAGNWNFELYLSASSAGGTPNYYVELYKYSVGGTFTLIATNSAAPKPITSGTAIDLYLSSLAVPATTLLTTDRLAVRVNIVNDGRTITLHTQDSHLCQIVTTFSGGISALNGLTANTQYLAVGTSGTDFAISSVTDTHTFNLPTASATNRGALSSANWTTFNNKIGAGDTATMLSPYLRSTNFGLLKSGQTVSADTSLLATRLRVQKGIDSLGAKSALTYVPYTGATGTVDIGANLLTAGQFQAIYSSSLGIPFYAAQGSSFATAYFRNSNEGAAVYAQSSSSSATGVLINAQYGTALNVLNYGGSSVFKVDGNGQLTLASTITNGTYTYTLPSATGTLALTSQLNSGTVTNVATNFGLLGGPITTTGTIKADSSLLATRLRVQKGIDSLGAAKQAQLNGTGFVKASGTTISYDNSTYLTTSAASSTYLPLAGGTLTGALSGTSATFSSAINNLGLNASPSSTGTGVTYLQFRNTGGDFYLGRESSTGGGFFTGSSAYADVWYGTNAMQVIIGSVKRFEIATSGAATFSSSVTSGANIATTAGTVYAKSSGTAGGQYQLSAITMGYDLTNIKGWIQAGNASTFTALDINPLGGAITFGGAATFSSSITTGIPSGWSSAGAWKLGTKFTTTVALDTTGYITVDIGGTLYYLALASPL